MTDNKTINLSIRSGYTTNYGYSPDPTEAEYTWDDEFQTWVREASEESYIHRSSVSEAIATLNTVAARFINPEEVFVNVKNVKVEYEYDDSSVKVSLVGKRVANEVELKRIEAQIQKDERSVAAKKQSAATKAKATRERNKLLKEQDVQEFINAHPELKVEPK